MIDVFISYKREERELVFKINERLRALKVDTWFDAELRSGTAFQEEITAKVRQAKAVVVCWSVASVASRWVLAEATEVDREGKLCPVLVEPCAIPLPFNVLHAQDLSDWSGSGDHPSWLRFLAAVGQKIGVRVSRVTARSSANLRSSRCCVGLRPMLAILCRPRPPTRSGTVSAAGCARSSTRCRTPSSHGRRRGSTCVTGRRVLRPLLPRPAATPRPVLWPSGSSLAAPSGYWPSMGAGRGRCCRWASWPCSRMN